MSAPLSVLIEVVGEEQAHLAMAAIKGAGYVCVPVEPTEDMIEATWADALAEDARAVWKVMIHQFLLDK